AQVICAVALAGGTVPLDVKALLHEREATLASFRDPHASPLAAVARHDFAGDKPALFGSAPDDDVTLEGVPPHAASIRALADHFELRRAGQPPERVDPGARLLEPGAGEAEVSVFFRDATTGHDSYPVGRYVEAEPFGPDRYALDFNRAYNPTCAFSPLYNCPIPPRENVLPIAVRAGERDPGGH